MKLLVLISILISSSVSVSLAAPATAPLKGARTAKRMTLMKASFEKTWLRDASPDTMVALMEEAFPFAGESFSECTSLDESNRSLLGDNNPRTGRPETLHPNAGFANWLDQCIRKLTIAEQLALTSNPNKAQEALGLSLTKSCLPLIHFGNFGKAIYTCEWNKLSRTQKTDSALRLIHTLIGPGEVIADLGIAQSDVWLAEKLVTYLERNGESLATDLRLPENPSGLVTPVTAYGMMKYLILSMDIWKE